MFCFDLLKQVHKRYRTCPLLLLSVLAVLIIREIIYMIPSMAIFDQRWLIEVPVRILLSLFLFPLFCSVEYQFLMQKNTFSIFFCYQKERWTYLWKIWLRAELPITLLTALLTLIQDLTANSSISVILLIPIAILIFIFLLWFVLYECALLTIRLPQYSEKNIRALIWQDAKKNAKSKRKSFINFLFSFLPRIILLSIVTVGLCFCLILLTGGTQTWWILPVRIFLLFLIVPDLIFGTLLLVSSDK